MSYIGYYAVGLLSGFGLGFAVAGAIWNIILMRYKRLAKAWESEARRATGIYT